MIFGAPSNAANRLSVRGPGAEIEGGFSRGPPPSGGGKSRGPSGRGLTLAGTSHFAILHGTGGGLVRPPCVWPLIELELRGKNERVRLHERKPMVPNFKV